MSGALAGTAVVAGGSALATYLATQNRAEASRGLAGSGYETPDYSGIIDYLNGNWQQPNYQNYTETPYTTGYDQFLGSGKYLPRINNLLNRTNQKQNKQFQQQLSKTSPTLLGNIGQLGTNTAAQLRGEIPTDVSGQIQRNTAEQSIFGGYGGSDMARNLTSRDLGLTSLDMMQRGNQGLQLQNGLTQSVNPYHSNALDYLMTPGQLQQNAIGQNQFGTNVYNSNQTNSASIANQRAEMIARLMQGQEDVSATGQNTQNMLDYQNALAPNPALSAISSGAGSLASLYGSGAFSGFGGGNSSYAPTTSYGGTYTGSVNGMPAYKPQYA